MNFVKFLRTPFLTEHFCWLLSEHLALKDLIENRDLVIQKADKGNTVVILNKNDYISKLKVILSDSSKFDTTKTMF